MTRRLSRLTRRRWWSRLAKAPGIRQQLLPDSADSNVKAASRRSDVLEQKLVNDTKTGKATRRIPSPTSSHPRRRLNPTIIIAASVGASRNKVPRRPELSRARSAGSRRGPARAAAPADWRAMATFLLNNMALSALYSTPRAVSGKSHFRERYDWPPPAGRSPEAGYTNN